MKFSSIILAVTVAVCQARSSRIVGGEPAAIEKHPSIVQVEYNLADSYWMHNCGGTIISNYYILSAAHCFSWTTASRNRIRVGSAIRESGGTVIYLSWLENHPSYGTQGIDMDGDISVLRLAAPLTYSDAVQPIGIPPQGYEVPDNVAVVFAGWGDMESGSTAGSPILRDVTVFTVNREVCKEIYSSSIPLTDVTENMICAGILGVGGQSACQRDSGGPLYFQDVLVGVTSWAIGCGLPDYPSVSARVSAYTDWIVSLAV